MTFETANVELDEEYAKRQIGVKPDPYVVLSISDTGVGMTPADLPPPWRGKIRLDGEDDTGQGGRIGGNLLEHLLEGLPGRSAEQAEVLRVELEDRTQELGDGENELGVTDLGKNVGIEPLGEKEDSLLLA